MKLTFLWTALPAGFTADGTTLRLSVLVSPRLDPQPDPAATLDAFPAVRDWPGQDIRFTVAFAPGGDFHGQRQPPAVDRARWRALFPGSTPVRGFAFEDYSTRRVHSYPVANVVDFLRRQYSRAGVLSPEDLPAIPALAGSGWSDLRTVEVLPREGVVDAEKAREAELLKRFGSRKALPPGPPEPAMDFFQARYFFRPRSAGRRTTPVAKPDFDFHQALALLGDHPELLRQLGLVIDLTVPFAGQPGTGTVQVIPEKGFDSVDVSARTRFVLDPAARLFAAAPAPGSDLAPGRLRLDRPEVRLFQVDADGAALKAVDFANQLFMNQAGRLRSMDSDTTAGLPALRTGGLSLVRTGRAEKQAEAFKKVTGMNAALSPASPPELGADDVTRGWRVDVEDQEAPGAWRSLCRRTATYRFLRRGGAEPLAVTGEGLVTPAMMQHADPTRKDEVLLHEALFHWDGWSLAAPRPGQVLDPGSTDLQDPKPNDSGTPFDLAIDAAVVNGSLPRLRFGHTYRLRARTVDLAGNSDSFEAADANHASAALTYRRFEPVEAPALLVLSNEPLSNLPGESAARLVIRSRNSDESLDSAVSPETSARAVLPPRTAVSTTEQSGLLDTPTGLDASPATWGVLAAKDQAQLPDLAAAAPAEVPYLPDPFAVGAALRNLPGAGPGALQISFETAPDGFRAQPFTLAIVEDTGAPDWDPARRLLTVKLPKAQVARVRLSALVTPDGLDRLAVWHWIAEEAFDEEAVDRLRALALDGGHWMLTPFRELTLVHAVLQPLARPAVLGLQPRKTLGATFAAVDGRAFVHAASTGKIDLLAAWDEPTGFGPAAADRRSGGGHAFDVAVHDTGVDEVRWADRHHEFGDTRYRRVRYTAVATTRFRDYFSAAETADPADLSRSALAAFEADVLNSARPAAPDLLYIIPTFEWQAGADATGATSRRRGGLRVYLRLPWYSSGDGELLGVVLWPTPADGCTGPLDPLESPQTPKEIEQLAQKRRYTTVWGSDPIWLTGAVHQTPSVQCFPRAVAVEHGLSIEEDSTLMMTAGHEVGFDAERQLFYCDLDVDTGPSYYPFVRLALARYQPKSVQGAELSHVVLADFIQLAPDRLCWVAREPDRPDRVRIVVSGTGYRKNASFPCTSTIEVRLERFLTGSEGGLDWVPVSPAPLVLTNVQAVPTLAAWDGTLTVPAVSGARFRLIVEEWESFLADVPSAEPLPGNAFGQGRQRRLVYADAVEVPLV
jgi:hypothetical protein